MKRKYSGNKIFLYKGKLHKDATGYNHVVVYTNNSRNELYIYKIKNLNI